MSKQKAPPKRPTPGRLSRSYTDIITIAEQAGPTAGGLSIGGPNWQPALMRAMECKRGPYKGRMVWQRIRFIGARVWQCAKAQWEAQAIAKCMGLRYEHLIWPGSTVEEDPEARRSREWSRAKMAEDGFTPGDEW